MNAVDYIFALQEAKEALDRANRTGNRVLIRAALLELARADHQRHIYGG